MAGSITSLTPHVCSKSKIVRDSGEVALKIERRKWPTRRARLSSLDLIPARPVRARLTTTSLVVGDQTSAGNITTPTGDQSRHQACFAAAEYQNPVPVP